MHGAFGICLYVYIYIYVTVRVYIIISTFFNIKMILTYIYMVYLIDRVTSSIICICYVYIQLFFINAIIIIINIYIEPCTKDTLFQP